MTSCGSRTCNQLHKSNHSSSLMVMIGDFNVTLYDGENTSKVNVLRDYGVQDFKDCVESLDMEDISMTGIEEVMVCTNAYKSAMLDEEIFLRQKSKIEWLKEDVADKFVEHFQKIFGVEDGTYPVDDPIGLFSKKISDIDALDMVKPVLNKEIKSIIFYIEDSKAPGPNGFTSKFFKDSWELLVVMIGDFNVTLYDGENTSKVNVLRDYGVQDFKDCVESLDMEDISMTGIEEVMVCTNAYKSAMLDEEIFLRQKSKIEWLKEDVADKFVEHFQKIFGVEDGTYPVDDPIGLFSKKISDIDALDMVKPVLNKEIKSIIFYIEDSKAPGPNGFTSKFFKDSWELLVVMCVEL
nr:hypothetical protein [Tanacetum cinerariifolium]